LAVAIEPWAGSALALLSLGGIWALAAPVGTSLVLLSPVLLIWTPAAFLEAERLQLTHHPDTGNALDLPILQLRRLAG
jgi:hypothetical protein